MSEKRTRSSNRQREYYHGKDRWQGNGGAQKPADARRKKDNGSSDQSLVFFDDEDVDDGQPPQVFHKVARQLRTPANRF